MSTVVRDLQRARTAYGKPTLKLLNQRNAPFILAIFSTLLPAEQTRLPAEQFHLKVATCLELLREHDPAAPDEPARQLCRDWVKSQWLWRASNDAGEEEYGLTSHAREALEYVNQVSGPRNMFGESRIRTILNAAQHCATLANPDPTARIRRLEEQIVQAQAEIDRINTGEDTFEASDDQILDAYLNLAQLLAALPADFARVSEAVKVIHRSIVAELREETRTSGEVIDGYLARADKLDQGSLEGRAFRGAVELLRDRRLLAELRADIDAILAHEFVMTLNDSERQALRQTVNGIRRGMATVTAERARLSASLSRNIKRWDIARDRELDEVLQDIRRALPAWVARTGPRTRVPLELGIAKPDVGHLRERIHDPADQAPPAPLAVAVALVDGDLWEQARQQGGPNLPELRRQVAIAAPGCTAAEMFNDLPEQLRRPVEVLGLLHAAADRDAPYRPQEQTQQYLTLRPDGTTRTFTGPALPLRQAPDESLDEHGESA
jgi:hypothetical protein